MNQTVTAQADIQNGTRHMFLYMSGWSQVSDSRYDHDRHYRYQLFEPPLGTGVFFCNDHHQQKHQELN
jgi:hypothetical protein